VQAPIGRVYHGIRRLFDDMSLEGSNPAIAGATFVEIMDLPKFSDM